MARTAQGRALYDVVAPFLESLRVTVDALRAGSFGGVLRVGAAALLVQELLPGWLRALQRRHPEVEVTLTELRSPDLGLLRSGELDLLVDHIPTFPPTSRRGRSPRSGASSCSRPATPPPGRRASIHTPPHRSALPQLRGRSGEPRAAAESGGGARGLGPGAIRGGLHRLAPRVRRRGARLLGGARDASPRSAPGRHPRIPLRLPESELAVHAAWLRGVPNPMLAAALDVAPSRA